MVRQPRVICKQVNRKVQKERARVCKTPPFLNWPQGKDPNKIETEIDKLYAVIYRQSVMLYRFTDNYYGMPWINKSDIEDKGNGIYVIRFRCPPEKLGELFFRSMAEDVCCEIGSELHFFHEIKEEYNLPYAEGVWIIQKSDDWEEEEIEDNFYLLEEITDENQEEPSSEEIEERQRGIEKQFI